MKGTTNSQRGTGGGGEKLVISLKTNQASHEDLIGAKFSVVINGNATEYTWQGASMTIDVTPMLNYTVEFGDVEGYAKPEPITHTAVDGNDRFVTGTYNTELVTVNVSAEEGEVSGYEIQIISYGNVLYTQTTSSGTYKFPYDTSYTIKAGDVSDYTTPESQTFTASQISRIVSVKYGTIPYGVYIQGVSGKLYTKSEWNNQETVNGYAVYTENCSFVAPLEAASRDTTNFLSGSQVVINGVVNTTNKATAILDYNGYENTEKIINQIGLSKANAARICKEYQFPNGQYGYLPSAGECKALIDNREEIKALQMAIDGSDYVQVIDGNFWTSTQYNYQRWWVKSVYSINTAYTDQLYRCYAFTKLF